MSANQACFPIAAMARVLGVSKAGYYAWLQLEEHGALEALLELREAGNVRFIGMSGTLPHLIEHIAMVFSMTITSRGDIRRRPTTGRWVLRTL
jgi:hypothetical protein